MWSIGCIIFEYYVGFTLFQVRTVFCGYFPTGERMLAASQHSPEAPGRMGVPPSLQLCGNTRGVCQEGVWVGEYPGLEAELLESIPYLSLYTSLSQTHDNREHLAMMERILGPIPSRMVRKTR